MQYFFRIFNIFLARNIGSSGLTLRYIIPTNHPCVTPNMGEGKYQSTPFFQIFNIVSCHVEHSPSFFTCQRWLILTSEQISSCHHRGMLVTSIFMGSTHSGGQPWSANAGAISNWNTHTIYTHTIYTQIRPHNIQYIHIHKSNHTILTLPYCGIFTKRLKLSLFEFKSKSLTKNGECGKQPLPKNLDLRIFANANIL